MRIIGGKFKGRTFRPGKSFKARPTTDFARENLFNILHHRMDIDALNVLDLFGGTGSISLEFASRGCSAVTCVEGDFRHYSFIRSVVGELKLEKVVTPLRADVFKYIKRATASFDLVFADPPYDLKDLDKIPDLILNSSLLKEDAILILEHGKTNDFSSHPNFEEIRIYGSVHFSFFNQGEKK